MGRFKKLVQKLAYGYKADSKSYEKYLRSIGVEIGKNFKLFCPQDTIIDTQNPYLLKIGNDVSMTGPITIITHDYSWKVFKVMDGRILGNQKPVIIGNNVFIGWGTTILGGTEIGDNVVIGAGSVVASKCESNSVYAGIPAKRIMSIEDLMKKRQDNQIKEASDLFIMYKKKFGENPPITLFESYFPVFTTKDNISEIEEIFLNRLTLENTEEKTRDYLRNRNLASFNGYEEFSGYCNNLEERDS